MSDAPNELADLLRRLGLADAIESRAVLRQIRRQGHGVEQFPSVWVDALARTGKITPYQAAEINAGRGARLCVGPYAIEAKAASLGYAERFAARRIESRQAAALIVADSCDDTTTHKLQALAARATEFSAHGLAPIVDCGRNGDRIWLILADCQGLTAREQLVRHGRLPADVVIEIARRMADAMVHLEQAGLAHGDVSLSTLVLDTQGRAVLLAPGLRPIVRPSEGFAHAGLPPDCYDAMAPERIESSVDPNSLSDFYGCGCVWWHLLTGRACFAGGNARAKLQAHLAAAPADVRQLAPETPAALAEVVVACLERDPRRRPRSARELVERLGPPAASGRLELARWMKPAGRETVALHVPIPPKRATPSVSWPVVATAAALVAFGAVLWSMGLPSGRGKSPEEEASKRPAPQRATEQRRARPTEAVKPNELLLTHDRPVVLEPSELADGMRVACEPGGRATVLVRGAPLVIAQQDVLFDGIDFLWRPDTLTPGGTEGAMLCVEAGRVRFRNCTFQAAAGEAGSCAAVEWVFPVDREQVSLAAGKMSLAGCVFHRIAAAVDARVAAAVTIECENVLHLGPGPMVRLDHAPKVEEPLGLVLENVTLRHARAVLEVHDSAAASRPGTISVSARLCVFAPRSDGALLVLAAEQRPDALAKAFYWSGEGGLVVPEAPMAQWAAPSRGAVELNDAAFSIAGLVRSPIQFADAAEGTAWANAATHWQAPLKTGESPGIDAERLPEPLP